MTESRQYAVGEQSLVESLQRALPAAAAAAAAMSPLARSLLALAALLAIAESGDYNCVTKMIGRNNISAGEIASYSPFFVAHPGRKIDTPIICRNIIFLRQVGQNVTACNINPGHHSPTIKADDADPFSSVDIDPCEDPHGCIVYVTQYCEYPPHN
ncbi:uncharacterized protein LOC133533786 [Cydia pomonella]|uniref:uncharacterized protein LOC133533786 n=1 Tax=Cydia pomonella TaxID=82600 RepID=UPI002ADDE5B5|nr:uncharacterized protein LOC133533786 [Cydia pomonella]